MFILFNPFVKKLFFPKNEQIIQNGYIMDGSGDIIFKMSYEAVLFRPFVNEVSDGIIEKILPLDGGIHVKVGPMLVFIPKEYIPNTYILEEKNNYYYNCCYFDLR